MKPEALENVVTMLRELASSYEETHDLMSGLTKEMSSTRRRLWTGGEPSRSLLVKLGLMLIASPVPPVISEAAGAILVSAGLIHSKIRKPPLYIEDVYNTFPHVIKKLQAIKRELV